MARVKLLFLNIFFILTVYFWAVTGLVIVSEIKSSAAENITSREVSAVENPRPITPRREITSQRIAPLNIDSDLPPFWSR